MSSHMSDAHDSSMNHSDDAQSKWKNQLVESLQRVQKQVHPTLNIQRDALEYIESLILKLLDILCQCQPHGVDDVEHHVKQTFPHPIDKWAIQDATMALEKGKKKSPLVLPVDKIHHLLKEDKKQLGYKVDSHVTMYITAVLEYIAADILKLTGNYVKNIKHYDISLQDIKVAMCADKVLMDMFFQDDDDDAFTVEEERVVTKHENQTYEDVVKDLIYDETQYMRDLNMIIKVFREPFARLFPTSKDIETIFSNIVEVQSVTYKLLSSLEDTKEMCEDTDIPLVGACFEDIAEGVEFDVYSRYTEDSLKPLGRERLHALLKRRDVNETLESAGHGFKDTVRYVLPKLLMGPIYHCLHYFEVLTLLAKTSEDEEDVESINNAKDMMCPLKKDVERRLGNVNQLKRGPGELSTLRFQGRAEKEAMVKRMNDLQRSIDGWDGKNISQTCHVFITEGILLKYTERSKRKVERCVFLLDGLIIFTKPNTRRLSVTAPSPEYRLKEKFQIHRINVTDREDTDELKNSFELDVRDHPNITLVAKSAEEKAQWMAALLSLLKRSMLERLLDTRISIETRQQPLKLPSPEQYRFAEEDSDDNIVFEENRDNASLSEGPQIKGGTLVKLVERLTYHTYADPKFVKTFLTTYRTFCKPSQLLDLLIERFNIIEPELDPEDSSDPNVALRDDLKRFRKEYTKPVQFRVLNVLKSWVDKHWYDFDEEPLLLDTLQCFLDSIKAKAIRKWVESINKIITRKLKTAGIETPKQITFPKDSYKPKIEWHLATNEEGCKYPYDIMTLHPIEIARQVTLLESDLYRAVKPSEMVGSVWTKENKHETSQNLLKMSEHSTNFTFWLERCILESENFEERVAVLARTIEIMIVFQELNNFNGILEVLGALSCASVHRLEHSFEEVDQKHHKLRKAYDETKELNSDHSKKYYEKLRSINPPCIPYLGNYLTNILLTEEGNPDFLPNRPDGIINFSKRRKVAEICGEIQQYQNQPYCLEVEPSIREFFEKLDPLEGRTVKEFNDDMYSRSLELEPRNSKQPAKFEKKRQYALKSPGIKLLAPSSRNSSSSTLRGTIDKLSLAHSQMRLNDGDNESLASQSIAPAQHHHHHLGEASPTSPLTPSTPLTPPPHDHVGGGGPHSEFTLVNLPDRGHGSMSSGFASMGSGSFHSTSTLNQSIVGYNSEEEEEPSPPPRRPSTSSLRGRLPPRMVERREPSIAESRFEQPPGIEPRMEPRLEPSPRLEPRMSVDSAAALAARMEATAALEGTVVSGISAHARSPVVAPRTLHYRHAKQPPPPPLDIAPPLPPRKKRTGSSSSVGTIELSPHSLTPTELGSSAGSISAGFIKHGHSSSFSGGSTDLMTSPPALPPPSIVESSNDNNHMSTNNSSPNLSNSPNPPPLPPRRERHLNSTLNRQFGMEPFTQTLPRHARVPYHHNAMLTLPRRNSERDTFAAAQPKFENINGGGAERGGSVTPELPPKTYKSTLHSRQQSS